MRAVGIGAIGLAAAIAACGTLTAGDAPGPDAGADGVAPLVDGGVGGEGGAVGEVGIAPCDKTEVPPVGAIFVSTNGADGSTGTGTAGDPHLTIQSAITHARAFGVTSTIVVGEGTYDEGLVIDSFAADITIDGGWTVSGAAWSRDCSADRVTKTVVHSTEDIGVRINALGPKRAQLSNLSIRTRSGVKKLTSSRIAVLATDSIAALFNTSVIAEPGNDGLIGSPGAPGVPLCTDVVKECLASPGAPGVDRGSAPGATTTGAIDAIGYHPADGIAGALSGGDGTYGTPGGGMGSSANCYSGQNATCDVATFGIRTSAPGRCGCGGGGGAPGSGGGGGGASIGLLVAGGSVVVKFSEIAGGNGGAGADGGTGGGGSPPSQGAQGADAECWDPMVCHDGACPGVDCRCYHEAMWPLAFCDPPKPVNHVIPGGTAGSAGTRGGNGESGGGGAGGPSYAYVAINNAQVVVSESKRAFGSGGNGGAGAIGGPSGEHP